MFKFNGLQYIFSNVGLHRVYMSLGFVMKIEKKKIGCRFYMTRFK